MDPKQKRLNREKIRLKSQRFRADHPEYDAQWLRQWRLRRGEEYRAANRERGKQRYLDAKKTLEAVKRLIKGMDGVSASLEGRKVVLRYQVDLTMVIGEGKIKTRSQKKQAVTDAKSLFSQQLHQMSLKM